MKKSMRLVHGNSWLELDRFCQNRDSVEFRARSGLKQHSSAYLFRMPLESLRAFQSDLRRINKMEVCTASLVDPRSGERIIIESTILGRLVIEVSFDAHQNIYRDPRAGFEADQTCVGPFLRQLNLTLEKPD